MLLSTSSFTSLLKTVFPEATYNVIINVLMKSLFPNATYNGFINIYDEVTTTLVICNISIETIFVGSSEDSGIK